METRLAVFGEGAVMVVLGTALISLLFLVGCGAPAREPIPSWPTEFHCGDAAQTVLSCTQAGVLEMGSPQGEDIYTFLCQSLGHLADLVQCVSFPDVPMDHVIGSFQQFRFENADPFRIWKMTDAKGMARVYVEWRAGLM